MVRALHAVAFATVSFSACSDVAETPGPKPDAGNTPPPPADDAGCDASEARCQVCDHDCLGARCVNGLCEPENVFLAPADAEPQDLVADADALYVSLSRVDAEGAVHRLSKAGLVAPQLAIAWNPLRLALHGDKIYFTVFVPDAADADTNLDGIGYAPISPDAGVAHDLTFGARQPFAQALAVDDDHVYWSKELADTSSDFWSASPSAADARSIATDPDIVTSLVADGSSLYYIAHAATGGAGRVMRMNTDGTNASAIGAASPTSRALHVDGAVVYWSTGGGDGSTIQRAATTGGASTVFASNQAGISAITSDAKYVYWSSSISLGAGGGGAVYKLAKNGGGAPIPLASHDARAGALVVDAEYVYWVSETGVWRVAK